MVKVTLINRQRTACQLRDMPNHRIGIREDTGTLVISAVGGVLSHRTDGGLDIFTNEQLNRDPSIGNIAVDLLPPGTRIEIDV